MIKVKPNDTWTEEQIRQYARRWEREEGWDSVETIERVYEQTRSGAYMCPYPTCNMIRSDPIEMWKHVYFSKKHKENNV